MGASCSAENGCETDKCCNGAFEPFEKSVSRNRNIPDYPRDYATAMAERDALPEYVSHPSDMQAELRGPHAADALTPKFRTELPSPDDNPPDWSGTTPRTTADAGATPARAKESAQYDGDDRDARFHTWEVQINRYPGSKLGVSVATSSNSKSLQVSGLIGEGGVVETWNDEHPDLAVMEGDLIVGVNGLSGDSGELVRECQKNGLLKLTVARCAPTSARGRHEMG